MIREQLHGKTSKEKAAIKAHEIAKLDVRGHFARGDLDIEILEINTPNVVPGASDKALENAQARNGRIEATERTELDGGIELFVRAKRNGRALGFGKRGDVEIERIRIFNPPILVDDPNGDIVRTWTDEDGIEHERRLREDPEQAIRESIAHTVSVIGKEGTRITPGKVGNTTSTFHPAAGTNEPVDGTATFTGSGGQSYMTVRNAATGNGSQDTLTSAISCRHRHFDGNRYQIVRGIFLFDTSPIGADAITAATFSFAARGGADGTDDDGESVEVVASTPGSTSSISTADYDQLGSTSFGSLLIANWTNTDGVYNDWTLNGDGRNAIDKDGITKFGLRTDGDIAGDTPTGTNSIGGYFADESGTSKDPKLVVEHEEGDAPDNAVQLTDSGAATESVGITVVATVQDAGAAEETATPTAALALADSVDGTDTVLATLFNFVSLQDGATGADAVSALVSLAVADSAFAADAVAVLSEVVLADAAVAEDAVRPGNVFLVSDTGQAEDALAILTALALKDEIAANEQLDLFQSVRKLDSGLADDVAAIINRFKVADTGTSLETVIQAVFARTFRYRRRPNMYNRRQTPYSRRGMYKRP